MTRLRILLTGLLLLVMQIILGQGPGKTVTISYTGAFSGNAEFSNLFKPYDSTSSSFKHPLIIAMEGAGQVGHYLLSDANTFAPNSVGDLCYNHGATMRFYNNYYSRYSTFIVITCYKPTGGSSGSWEPYRVYDAYEWALANIGSLIDTTQIYVSGLSLGGGGAWSVAADGRANPRYTGRISAVAAFSGTEDPSDSNLVKSINLFGLHVLGIDAQNDGTTGGQTQHYAAVQQYNTQGTITPKMRFIFPQYGDHYEGWLAGYDTGHLTLSADTTLSYSNFSFTNNPNTYEWFLKYAIPAVSGSPPSCTTNSSPSNGSTVSASTSATVSWAASSGASSYDLYYYTGSIPGSPTVSSIGATTYNITGLTATTTYHWFVVPKNGFGSATGCSSSVTTFTTSANSPPVSNAGSNQSATLPTSSVSLNGSSSYDPDGSISSYSWVKTSGPSSYSLSAPTSATTTASGLVAGTYIFTLTVTDNLGATNSSTVTITVNSGGSGHTLAGYIYTTAQGDYTSGCAVAGSNVTTAVYTTTGTIANGNIITNSSGGSLGISDYAYYAYSPISGLAPTITLQIYSAGTINGQQSCGRGIPTCPTNLPTIGVTANSALVSWNSSSTATLYNLMLNGSSVGTTTGTNYYLSGLSNSTVYSFYVIPSNTYGTATGCNSNATTFTTSGAGVVDSVSEIPVIVDMSEASGNDPNRPENGIDAGRQADPLHGVSTDTTTSGNKYHNWGRHNAFPMYAFPQYYPNGNNDPESPTDSTNFPGNRQMRVYFSFVNYTNKSDTSRQFKMHRIWWYEPSGLPAGLSARLINADSGVLAQSTHDAREIRVARPDSLLPPFDSLVTTGVAGWHEKLINARQMRFMLVLVTQQANISFNTSQMVFYGQYNSSIDTSKTQKEYTAPVFKFVAGDLSHTMWAVNSINNTKGINSSQVANWGASRDFIGLGGKSPTFYFLVDTLHPNIPPIVSFWFNVTGDFTIPYFRQLKSLGVTSTITLNSTSGYNQKHGWNTINIDNPSNTAEPEIAANYKTNARMAFLLAAKTGVNNVSSSLTPDWGGTDAGYPNGLNLGIAYSFGNEYRSHRKTKGVVFAERSAEFDGDEGRLGTGYGMKSADSTVILTDEPNAIVDSSGVKGNDLLAQWLRNDHMIPNNAIDQHQYPGSLDSAGTVYTYTQQIGSHSVSPERSYSKIGYNYLTYHQEQNAKIQKYGNYNRRTKMLSYRTETGVGQDSIISVTDSVYMRDGITRQPQSRTSVGHDLYTIIPIRGLTADQTRALYAQRYEWCNIFSGYDKVFVYTMENSSGSAISSALFGSMAEGCCSSTSPSDSFKLLVQYADFNVHASSMKKARNYGPDAVILGLDSINLNLFRTRNVLYPDSVCYPFWLGSIAGDSMMVTINLPNVPDGPVNIVTPNYFGTTPIVRTGMVSGGNISVMATEMPQAIYALESTSSGSAPLCTTNITPSSSSNVTQPVNLTFNSSATATNYDLYLYQNGTSIPGSPSYNTTGLSVNVSGLATGLNYKWFIVPKNSIGSATGCSTSATTFTVIANFPYKFYKVPRKK